MAHPGTCCSSAHRRATQVNTLRPPQGDRSRFMSFRGLRIYKPDLSSYRVYAALTDIVDRLSGRISRHGHEMYRFLSFHVALYIANCSLRFIYSQNGDVIYARDGSPASGTSYPAAGLRPENHQEVILRSPIKRTSTRALSLANGSPWHLL